MILKIINDDVLLVSYNYLYLLLNLIFSYWNQYFKAYIYLLTLEGTHIIMFLLLRLYVFHFFFPFYRLHEDKENNYHAFLQIDLLIR